VLARLNLSLRQCSKPASEKFPTGQKLQRMGLIKAVVSTILGASLSASSAIFILSLYNQIEDLGYRAK
jgi:hypothetical protein